MVDSIPVSAPKSSEMREAMKSWGLEDALIIDADANDNLHLAGRNFPNITTTDVDGINPWLMLRHKSVVMTASAVKQIEERLS